jgi:hypothetical protein
VAAVKSPLSRIGLIGVIAFLGVAAAGCSNNNGSTVAKGTTTTTSAQKGGATTIPYSASKNARADVTINGTCLHEPNNSWVLYGTVANPTTKKTGFTIVVDYVTQPGGTVLETKIVKVLPVAPHTTATWGSAWTNAGNNVGCVIRQAQYS